MAHEYTEQEKEQARLIHENIRNILIKYDNVEHGDCIIDEICQAVGIPPTTIYYEEE